MWLDIFNSMRKASGMGLDELSKRSGVPKSTLSKITSGVTKSPPLETMRKLVYAMGYTLNDLDEDWNPNHLTPYETKIALAYREASADDRAVVEITLRKYMQEDEGEKSEKAIG